MNKKRSVWAGMGKVFAFTFKNQAKGKGFLVSTVLIPIVFFLIFFFINVGVALAGKGEGEPNYNIDKLYVVDETQYQLFSDLFQFTAEDDEILGDVQVTIKRNQTVEQVLAERKEANDTGNWGILSLSQESYVDHSDYQEMVMRGEMTQEELEEMGNYFHVLLTLPDTTEVTTETEEYVLNVASTCASLMTISAAEVTTEQYTVLSSMHMTQVIEAGEKEDNFVVVMMTSILPMLFVLIMYVMILLYSQGMGKTIISEKSSKLMEMMLTSLHPMALIAGKIFALIAVALMQFFLWIVCGILGFYVGDLVAKVILPEYNNVVYMAIDLIREYGMEAFSPAGIILALLSLVFGFSLYCMISALIASTCSKTEEVTQKMGYFTLIVVAGYIFSFVTLMDTESIWFKVCDYIPFSAAFRMPCDVLLGTFLWWEGLISLILTIACTMLAAYLAGKFYYMQVYYNGITLGQKFTRFTKLFQKKEKPEKHN